VDDGKVGVLVRLGHRLDKVVGLAQVVGLQLVLEGLVRGLREEGLLFEDGKDTHWLFEQVDAGAKAIKIFSSSLSIFAPRK